MNADKVIVGSGLAALVAATESAKLGQETVLVKHSGRWGGHFAGIDIEGKHFDAGMNIIELTSAKSNPLADLASYNTSVRNDIGRFFPKVQEFLQNLQPIREIQMPQCIFRGSIFPDFLLCNYFKLFEKLTEDEKNEIVQELHGRSKSNWIHASNKINHQEYHTAASYEQTSLYNHGHVVHKNIIEPFVRKISGRSSQRISSLFHRRYWAPLFYPETIVEAAKGNISSIANTVIHYPKHANFDIFAQRLLESAKRLQCLTILDEEVERIETDNNLIAVSSNTIRYKKLGWAGKLADFQNLIHQNSIEDKLSERTSLAFQFITMRAENLKKDFSVLFNLDDDHHFYRITNQSNCAQMQSKFAHIVIEYNLEHLQSVGLKEHQDILSSGIDSLSKLSIIGNQDCEINQLKLLKNLLPIPSMPYENVTSLNQSLAQSASKNICLFGESSGIATRSFADSILQGIKFSTIGDV